MQKSIISTAAAANTAVTAKETVRMLSVYSPVSWSARKNSSASLVGKTNRKAAPKTIQAFLILILILHTRFPGRRTA